MNKTKIFAALTALFAAAAVSCSKKAPYQMALADSRMLETDVKKILPQAEAAFSDAERSFGTETADGVQGAEHAAAAFERKLIRRGYLTLEVNAIPEAAFAVEQWCARFGGYIESSYAGETNGNVTARIPSASFADAMNEAGKAGTVKSKSVSTEDVSERFYDLQTRLETRKIMRTRLQSYLSQSKDTKDMLQIESELNRVMSDIESMEGSMKRLAGQIDYSTISVDYRLPYRADGSGGFDWPDFGDGFRRFVSNIVDFFAGFVKVVLYVVIGGVPIFAVIAFLYWLLFGKIGLLRKIFNKLGGKEKEK